MEGSLLGALISLAVATFVTFALLPSIQTFITDANLTGISSSLATLIPFAIVLAIMLTAFRVAGVIG